MGPMCLLCPHPRGNQCQIPQALHYGLDPAEQACGLKAESAKIGIDVDNV